MQSTIETQRARRHALAAADALDRGHSDPSIGDLMLDMALRNGAAAGAAPMGRGGPREVRDAWRLADALAERAPVDVAAGPYHFEARPGRRDCAIIGWDQLRAERALGTTPGGKGGYLVGVDTLAPADPLWQDSVIGMTGVQVLEGLTSNAVIPRVGAGGVTVSIQSGEGVAPSAVDPTLGAVSVVQRVALATVQVSIQQARQAPSIQAFLARLLLRLVRAKFDTLLLQGAGGAEPQGLANLATTTGLQQVSGTSLAWAGILNAQRLASASGVPDSAMTWVGAPSVRETLGARERTTGSGRTLWDDGRIAGMTALATPDAPASTLFVGGFSNAVLALFGDGLEIRFDPHNQFNTGHLAWQVFVLFDIVFPQPAAFVRIASIT